MRVVGVRCEVAELFGVDHHGDDTLAVGAGAACNLWRGVRPAEPHPGFDNARKCTAVRAPENF